MISYFLSRTIVLALGTLYPAYCSFKAIRGKNVKEYVKWTMYWIVFAIFLLLENFTDMFLSWMPFYYELKILIILWLVLPMTRGSSYLYRKWIHPYLKKYEPLIDEGLSKVGQTGLEIVRRLGIRGMNIAAQTVVSGAMIGQEAIGEAMRRTSQSEHVDSGVEGRGSQGEGEEPFEIIDSDELPIPSTTHQEYHERGQEVKEEMAGVRQRRN